ncbi:MAG: hypothetical protein IJ228_03685 [Succinivibrio sp.]|nr:hypothetical protein [Succinivibrio sp.]
MRPEEFLPDAADQAKDSARQLAQMLAEEAERTYRTDMATSREEGIEIGQKQGIEIGQEKGIELGKSDDILNMHKKKFSTQVISAITGYSAKKIEEIIAAEQRKNSKGANAAVPAATLPQDHGTDET